MTKKDQAASLIRSQLTGTGYARSELTRGNVVDEALLFLSLDIADSTKLKLGDSWVLPLRHFFEGSASYAQKEGFRIWKYRGDEALFFSVLDNETNIAQAISSARYIQARLNKDFQSEDFSGGATVKIKAAMWVAAVQSLPRGSLDHERERLKRISSDQNNIMVSIPGSQDLRDSAAFEFFGESIDRGFRMAAFAHTDCVSLSLELAYLLMRSSDDFIRGAIRVVGFKKFKGVASAPVPILWYSDEWAKFRCEGNDVNDRSELEVGALELRKELEFGDLEEYCKTYDLTKHVRRVDLLSSRVRVREGSAVAASGAPMVKKQAEVHCVAVCIDQCDRVLLGQRRSTAGSRLSGCWEFGCAQLHNEESFSDAIQRDYRHDFNLEIDDICDDPVATFQLPKRNVPGIIFVARVRNDGRCESNKHERIWWASEKDIDALDEAFCVPDLKSSYRKAKNTLARLGA